MNRQIRQLGGAMVILFIVLFVALNNTQVVRASALTNNPLNNRNAVRDFAAPRGVIKSADGVTLADSVPSNDTYEQLRQYPEGALFGQLTGFFSFTYGQEGVEKTYNDDLTGKTYALKNIGDLLTDRVRTNDVTLSVTKQLQQTSREALGDRKGAVVALDPKTGAVLALWSNPSYDPTPFASHDFKAVQKGRASLLADKNKPMLPRAFRESYAPGSTEKVVTASAAFDHKPELTTTRYPVNRFIPLPQSDKTLSNFGDESCGGTIADLLRVSCNTGFAKMGIDLGGDNLAAEANAFGYNSQPPLDLPSAAKSRFPSADKLRRNAPARAYSAIGQQDVSATPLQMALVASAIANDGNIMAPHVMKDVRDSHGDVVRSAKPQVWQKATSKNTADQVKKLMIEVANRGTATAARIPGVQVAAKTGTAQTDRGLLHAWLISFAPADDPKIAVAVILENQPGFDDTTGGRLAAPIAQKVMKTALGIP